MINVLRGHLRTLRVNRAYTSAGRTVVSSSADIKYSLEGYYIIIPIIKMFICFICNVIHASDLIQTSDASASVSVL